MAVYMRTGLTLYSEQRVSGIVPIIYQWYLRNIQK